MRRKTRGLLAALLGVALALAVGLVPGMAKTARADVTPTYRITATDPYETVPLSESAPAIDISPDNGDNTQMVIMSVQKYPLWVGDRQVTDDNMSGEGWDFNATSNTLTLDGAYIMRGHAFSDVERVSHSYGIYYTGTDPLTIVVASDSTVDVSEENANVIAGIYCESSGLTITGAGKLTAKGGPGEGISAEQNVTIDKGVVDATGGNGAIMARREGSVVITNDSTVEANGSINGSINGKTVTINSGTVKASGEGSGIFGHSVTIRGGEVTVTASDDNGKGIWARFNNFEHGNVTITGGAVSATGGAEGYGIYAEASNDPELPGTSTVTIDGDIASVTASGGKQAIEGTVKNAVAGMGWTDAAGTQDKALIAIKADGQDLGAYKKVQFPTPVAKVTTAPEATNPTHNGEAQELVTAGTAEGGAMRYSLDGETWSEKVPTGIDVKSYTVWYKVVGDDQHADGESQKVTSTITGSITLSGSSHVQGTGNAAAGTEGKGILIGTTGEAKRLEQFSVALPKDVEGSIEYRGHLQSKGWVGWVKDGAPCGTSGQSRRIEAVQMTLSGKVADTYSVWYRVHSQTFGWLGWACDGQAAGTAGQSRRAEAVEIQVLSKGQVPEGYEKGQASYVGAATGRAHVQGIGWASPRDPLEFGTTGRGRRLEAIRLSVPNQPLAGGIEYEVHAQGRGWMPEKADGALAGTTGQGRRLEAVRVSLTGDLAKEGGYSVWYRVHSQSHGWLGWAHDGEPAGTTGLERRAEAIDVQVLPQGQVPKGYDASRAACVTK